MILILFLSAFVGLLLVEIFTKFFNGQWLKANLNYITNFLPCFLETHDDDARQKLILESGFRILKFSVLLFILIASMGAIAILPTWALDWSSGQKMIYWVACSCFAIIWLLVRKKLQASIQGNSQILPDYSYLDRCLHWLALEPSVVRRLTFDLERQFALAKPSQTFIGAVKATNLADGSVYVCGLARSGTTILLRILDQIDSFRSLTYREMPFVLAPNLWGQISQSSHINPTTSERSHGDGITVNFDSPESFEEVFWRTFGKRQIDNRSYGMHEPTADTIKAFSDYRSLVANPYIRRLGAITKQKRYLSKNNNNLLRLGALSQDPSATILLVYRNPFDTARSLHRQHLSFCTLQKDNPFVLTYMNWLGHYEFGLNHLPFSFALSEMDGLLMPSDINYWLDYWIVVHRYILSQPISNLHLVNHDEMRIHPARALSAIFSMLNEDADVADLSQQIRVSLQTTTTKDFSSELTEKALAAYQSLISSQLNILSNSGV